MRFTKQNSRFGILYISLIFLLSGSFLLSVACQTKEEKTASALKKCQRLLDQDNVREATDCYAEVVKANPESAGEISQTGKIAVFKKCVSFKEKKDFENAIVCFEGFTALEPKMASNYFQLADSYYNLYLQDYKSKGTRDFDLLNKAKNSLNDGLLLNEKDAAAYALRGEVWKELGSLEQAVKSYEQALEIDPNVGIYWIKLGQIQEISGKYDKAIESYEQAFKINSEDTLALYFLGLAYEKIGKPDEAVKTYEKLLTIKPGDEDARQRLNLLKKEKIKN